MHPDGDDMILKLTLLDLTVLLATLRDSLDAPDPDGKSYAFGRSARHTIWNEIARKCKAEKIELDIQK
jgi:hypothetical protein